MVNKEFITCGKINRIDGAWCIVPFMETNMQFTSPSILLQHEQTAPENLLFSVYQQTTCRNRIHHAICNVKYLIICLLKAISLFHMCSVDTIADASVGSCLTESNRFKAV